MSASASIYSKYSMSFFCFPISTPGISRKIIVLVVMLRQLGNDCGLHCSKMSQYMYENKTLLGNVPSKHISNANLLHMTVNTGLHCIYSR